MSSPPKVAFLTGAGSGIGRSSALRLSDDGLAVVVTDVVSEAAEETATLVRARGGTALALRVDVSRSADVDAAVSRTVSEFGRVDVLVASAGVGTHATIYDMTDEQWAGMLSVDLNGVFYCLRAVSRAMINLKVEGVLLPISSAFAAIPGYGQAAYCVSKSGITRLTECAALELGGFGIRVNAIGPGVINTAFAASSSDDDVLTRDTMSALAIKRTGEPDEVAGLVSYLASPDARYITGQTIYIDGGYGLRGGNDLRTVFGPGSLG